MFFLGISSPTKMQCRNCDDLLLQVVPVVAVAVTLANGEATNGNLSDRTATSDSSAQVRIRATNERDRSAEFSKQCNLWTVNKYI